MGDVVPVQFPTGEVNPSTPQGLMGEVVPRPLWTGSDSRQQLAFFFFSLQETNAIIKQLINDRACVRLRLCVRV